jgi:hypothetical protein
MVATIGFSRVEQSALVGGEIGVVQSDPGAQCDHRLPQLDRADLADLHLGGAPAGRLVAGRG